VSSAQGLAADPKDGQFCFESALWNTVFKPENQIPLIKIFRQKDDEYVSILNQIREGKIKRKSFAKLSEYVGRQVASDALIQPTKIFPTRAKVDHVNMMEMAKLDGHEHEFKLKFMTDIPGVKKEFKYLQEDMDIEMKYLERSLLCESTMKLKVGSQVMCIVNMELPDGQMLCNGSQGIVTGFVGGLGTNPSPKIKFNGIPNEVTLSPHTWASEKYPGIGVSQLPLILAWAITIHKSQGASLDMAEIDVGSDIFECGQTYVALSRVRSLDGLYLTSLDISKILINKKVQDFYAAINTI